jgi:hypothetical protein
VLAATARIAMAQESGMQVPILYNDHHVNAAPDELKQGRVLAALVRGTTILVPLRSMFEAMGATVSFDATGKTATVSKPGAEIKVTVGKPEVVVNGESRPLDVPPEIYQGTVVVPIRVISEGMGAYVQWVPDQHVVVVRYVPPTPPPTPSPVPAPPETFAPPPTPTPTQKPYDDVYAAGDYLISPTVYNEFSGGNNASGSWAAHGAAEFSGGKLPVMVGIDWQQFQYQHAGSPGNINGVCNGVGGNATPGSPGCVTVIGPANRSINVGAFTAQDSDLDVRLGMRLLRSRVYLDFAYMWKSNNYGYPVMDGFGEGVEKLPDLDHALSWFGDWMYYPEVRGNVQTGTPRTTYNLQYIVTTFRIGGAYVFGNSPVFIEAGWNGESWVNKLNAPGNRTYRGAFVGLGLKMP